MPSRTSCRLISAWTSKPCATTPSRSRSDWKRSWVRNKRVLSRAIPASGITCLCLTALSKWVLTGDVRNWLDKKHNFEVIVGKSMLSFEAGEEERAPSLKRFGFVQTLDTQSKRRLYEVLQSQGLQMNQTITFLSDGDDTLRELQWEMSPKATHILDWFHLTMKLTGLGQYGKGLVQCEAVLGEAIRDKIERLQWSLWHGQVDKALGKIDDLESAMEPFSETYARFPRLGKALS